MTLCISSGRNLQKQAEDSEIVNKKLAEMISLLTCNQKPSGRKSIKYGMTSELKDILSLMDDRIRSLHSDLPPNSMLIMYARVMETLQLSIEYGKPLQSRPILHCAVTNL